MLHLVAQQAIDQPIEEPNSEMGRIGQSLATNLDVFNHPDQLTSILMDVHIVWAVIFILLGIACVLNGYRWRKPVVIILAGLSGVWAGRMLGLQVGSGAIMAVCLSVLFAVLAWPLLRYAVALFGGLAGAFAGANMWSAFEMDPDQHKIGAVLGLLIVGMLTFLAFRSVVILMTVIGGASMLVFGGLAAIMHVDGWREAVIDSLSGRHLMVPIIAASAAGVGAVVQFSGGFKGMAQLADGPSTAENAAEKKKAA